MGVLESEGRWRLERVVMRSRELVSGRRPSSSERNSEMVVDGGRASDRVGGSPVPAKLVTRMLILLGAILRSECQMAESRRRKVMVGPTAAPR